MATPTYSLYVTVMDSNGMASSALLTINVLEVDRPPTWVNGTTVWSMQLNDGSPSGTIGNSGTITSITGNGQTFAPIVSIGATNPNPGHTLLYYANAWSPPQAALYLYLDALLGQIGVSATAPGNQLTYNPSWNWTVPFTVVVNVSAVDNNNSAWYCSDEATIGSSHRLCFLQI